MLIVFGIHIQVGHLATLILGIHGTILIIQECGTHIGAIMDGIILGTTHGIGTLIVIITHIMVIIAIIIQPTIVHLHRAHIVLIAHQVQHARDAQGR